MIWSLEGTATVLAQISIILFRRSQIECMKHLAERSWRGKLRDTSSSWTNRWLDTWRTCRERCPVGRWDSALLLGRTFITYQRLKRLKTYYDDLRCIETISMCGWHGYVFSIPSHLQEMCHASFGVPSSLVHLWKGFIQWRASWQGQGTTVRTRTWQPVAVKLTKKEGCSVNHAWSSGMCVVWCPFLRWIDWLIWHGIQRFDYTYQFQQWHYHNSLAAPLEAFLKKPEEKPEEITFCIFLDHFLYLKFWEMTATL